MSEVLQQVNEEVAKQEARLNAIRSKISELRAQGASIKNGLDASLKQKSLLESIGEDQVGKLKVVVEGIQAVAASKSEDAG